MNLFHNAYKNNNTFYQIYLHLCTLYYDICDVKCVKCIAFFQFLCCVCICIVIVQVYFERSSCKTHSAVCTSFFMLKTDNHLHIYICRNPKDSQALLITKFQINYTLLFIFLNFNNDKLDLIIVTLPFSHIVFDRFMSLIVLMVSL